MTPLADESITGGPIAVATVAAIENSWAGVSVQLRSRTHEGSGTSAGSPLGSWTAGQNDLLEVMAVVDAVRTNADTVPVSLRSFLR